MNLAIQRLQQMAKETAAEIGFAKEAHIVHERAVAESAARIVHLTAMLADLKAALAALPLAALKAVEAPAEQTATDTKAKKR
jgi:hypothetical protein